MKTPKSIEVPLVQPLAKVGVMHSIQVTVKRLKRLKLMARWLNVRRPGGGPSLGALLDAIYHGQIVLRRRDDPEGREFWLTMEERESVRRGPVVDPRCPDDWRD